MAEKFNTGVIGIDRVVINNFTINNFESLKKKEILNDFEYSEKLEKKNNLFNLSYSVNLKNTGEMYRISSLEFNPSKILYGNNIKNASPAELIESLGIIEKHLKENQINVNFSEAKIKEVELNITLENQFESIEEITMLIGRANFKKSLGMYSFSEEHIPKQIKKERSLYINSKRNPWRNNQGKVIKIYDKTFEMERKGIYIPTKLIRIEILLGNDYFRDYMKTINSDNYLKSFVCQDIQKIFKKCLVKELKEKPQKYLLEIKKNLENDFNSFKKNEKLKREKRKEYKKKELIIPDFLKEERGVFEYLEKNSWIFDYNFLIEIIEKNIDSNHRYMYKKQVLDKYLHKNNSQKYEQLLKNLGIFF
ncbi:hypothetical protein [Fusobacterium sp. IOR10]|uniref:hypothetical protein n=1 Tax=Fusobacterium sp. IOR10 TaxID=2665157 RepID=UPI0013D10344|nr:hypothetical protein [Fusobacterium sp. IOR10]